MFHCLFTVLSSLFPYFPRASTIPPPVSKSRMTSKPSDNASLISASPALYFSGSNATPTNFIAVIFFGCLFFSFLPSFSCFILNWSILSRCFSCFKQIMPTASSFSSSSCIFELLSFSMYNIRHGIN
uniref:Uncharacterized protein n=1 Tax=uncultured marine crenarchaeote HF4000_APKG9P22 TaxID=455609 RepID=B3TBK8_9ARCH|nr:hypothetical protein ALOHA_HF4000APKG9P22ctg2g18 [uncultured marine crenarchaeote HF4000_APKG9P22]